MAGIPGTNVIAPVVPFSTTDVHPSHEARYGKGGYRTVATLAERDAIPAPRREAGMLVFVTADSNAYQLGSDLTTWAEFTSGVSSWNDLKDRPADFPPTAHAASHGQGGSDPVTVTVAQVEGLQTALDGKAALSHTHSASAITDAGTAISRNVPATGNASSSEVVLGSDSRLSDQRTPTDGSVTTAKLADRSVTAAKIANNENIIIQSLTTLGTAGLWVNNGFTNVFRVNAGTGVIDSGVWEATAIGVNRGGTGAYSASEARTNLGVAYGTTSGTVCQGNDSRLSDSRTPTSHVHGNITNAGAIGTTSGQIVVTTTGGVLTTAATISSSQVSGLGSLATQSSVAYSSLTGTPSTFAPAAHTQAWSTITSTPTTLSGYGITDGVTTTDSRLSDTRTPTDGSVTDAKITSGGLSTSSLNWAAIAAWQANTAYAKGDLVSNAGIAYRRSVAGTSGATFNVANWQQITPSEFVGSQIASGTVATARLGSGTASASNFLRGDGTWAAAGSTSASDLTAGTLSDDRLSGKANAAINVFLWSNFR